MPLNTKYCYLPPFGRNSNGKLQVMASNLSYRLGGYGQPGGGSKMVPIKMSSPHSYLTSILLYTLEAYRAPFGHNTITIRGGQTDRAIGMG